MTSRHAGLGTLALALSDSRFVGLGKRVRAERFADAKNLFHTEKVASVNRIIQVDALGNLLAALPAAFPGTGGYEERSIQLRAKVVS